MYMMVMAVAMAEGHYGISGDGGHGHSGCSHYVQEFSCIVHVHCTYIHTDVQLGIHLVAVAAGCVFINYSTYVRVQT